MKFNGAFFAFAGMHYVCRARYKIISGGTILNYWQPGKLKDTSQAKTWSKEKIIKYGVPGTPLA